MSNLEFAVGKRVVCIDDAYFWFLARNGAAVNGPRIYKGTVYTISDIRVAAERVLVALEGMPVHVDGEAFYYCAHRFRPVRETSIDCFTKLLEKQPELVGGNA